MKQPLFFSGTTPELLVLGMIEDRQMEGQVRTSASCL
jgi:hypothetical protein